MKIIFDTPRYNYAWRNKCLRCLRRESHRYHHMTDEQFRLVLLGGQRAFLADKAMALAEKASKG